MAVVADLIAYLKLDSAQFKQELEVAKTNMQSFADTAKVGVVAAAAAITGVLIGAIYELKSAISESTENIRELGHSAERLGIGVEAFQSLKFAAEASGVSADQLNTALKFMEKNLGNVEAGLAQGKLPEYFKDLGLNVSELVQLPIEQQFTRILNAINALPDPLERTASRIAIFGKSGQVMGSLGKDVGDLQAKFEDLGISLSSDQVNAVDEYAKHVTELTTLWGGFKNQLTVSLIPVLDELITWIENTISSMGGMQTIVDSTKNAIVNFVTGIYSGWKTLNTEIDLFIIGIEKAIVLFLKFNEITTLGLSRLLTNIHQDIENLQADINKKEVALVPTGNNTPTNSNLTSTSSAHKSISDFQNQSVNNGFAEALQQKAVTNEYKEQLKTLKEAVATQQQKISAATKEQQILKELIDGTGGENDRLKQSENSVKKIQDEFLNMQKNHLLDDADVEKVQAVEDAFQKFTDYDEKLKNDDAFKTMFENNRLNDFTKVLQYFNNPSNQFGAGNTQRDQKVALDIKIAAEEGFAAKVASSSENQQVIVNTVNELLSDTTRGELR